MAIWNKSLTAIGVAFTAAFSLAITQAANAAAVRMGGLFTDYTLPANDDGSTGAIPLGFTANFFGLNFNQAFVNNNGNITFDRPLGTFTPFDLNSTNSQIIAPFFADVDTRGSGSNLVTYGTGTVDGRSAFRVNYINVGYFSARTDRTNSFQLVLTERSDTGAGNFDIEFNYDQIQFETGDFSGGTDGLGGSSARVGYSNGTLSPGTFLELPGSAVNGALLDGGSNSLVANSVNSNVAGRYIFTARNGSITPAPVPAPPSAPVAEPPSVVSPSAPTPVPAPSSALSTLAFGALGAGYLLKRKLKKQQAVQFSNSIE